MSSIFGADTPTPPDPRLTAGAQTASNVSTAVANAFLNNTNQINPQGTLTFDPTGTYSFNDPSTGQTYNIPRFTSTQTLSAPEQAISDQNIGARTNLSTLANTQSGKLNTLLGTPLDTSGAPAAGNPNAIGGPQAVTGFDQTGSQQMSLGDAGAITRDYGPADNYSADRSRIEESLFSRLNPQTQADEMRLRQQLADQGIRPGSQAYDDAFRRQNDAVAAQRAAITQVGGQEQQRLSDLEARRAGFQNAAQQQAFQEVQAGGTFTNAAQQAAFQQAATRGQFTNLGLAQQLQQQQAAVAAQNAARQNYLTEQYAQRTEPINEVTALLSGGQVSRPNFNAPTSQQQIPTTDVAGLLNNNFSQNLNIWQQQNANTNALLGGILGFGGNVIRSDRRVKENIHKLGTVFAADNEGGGEDAGETSELPIYRYSYKDDPASVRHVGPMAQDVEKINPRAVRSIGGVKHIDTRRVMGSILRVA